MIILLPISVFTSSLALSLLCLYYAAISIDKVPLTVPLTVLLKVIKCAMLSINPEKVIFMATIHPILANVSAGISELKKNPMGVLQEAQGETVAILNRN